MNRDQVAHADARAFWVDRARAVKEHVRIEDVVGGVVSLKGKGATRYAFCPFHDNAKTPAFVVKADSKQFFHCFGCGANGDVIKFVMLKQGLSFREAVELLESKHGVAKVVATPVKPPPSASVPQVEDRQRLDRSLQMERQSVALTPDSPPVQYLLARAIVRPSSYGVGAAEVNDGWPVDLRYLERCWHDFERRNYPALVAAIRGYDGALLTMHRTYLDRGADGVWRKAKVEKAKLVVGSFGPGYIRLGEAADRMIGGEGIETTLSAMQLYRRPGLCYVTAGRMKSIEPPFVCSDYLIAADKGGKDRWGERHAQAGAARFGGHRKVRVVIPKIEADKGDFNDWVVERAAAAREAVPA